MQGTDVPEQVCSVNATECSTELVAIDVVLRE